MDAGRWAGFVGRTAYAARAAVYCLVAAIALDAARRFDPKEPRGVVGALHKLADRPGGRLLLGLLVVGLAAQVAWRGLQAFTDVERPHGRPPRWTTRIGWTFIGAFYAGILWNALRFLVRAHSTGGGAHKRSLVARGLTFAEGRAVAYGVAAGLVIFAGYELWKVWRAPFMDDFDPRKLDRWRTRVLRFLGRVGLFGRGLMFGAAGVLLARSAWHSRPEMIGTGDVLRHLMAGPLGQPLVAVIAIGLFAYAALMVGEAAWRRSVREPRV
jgi:uncharacterized protein DUF1206